VIINGERGCKILRVNTYFPFHALGLRCNPFRALTEEEWGDLALLPAELLALDPAAHVQILGERGHGKTSLLMGLAAHGRRRGKKLAYEYLAAGQNEFKTSLAGLDVFLLDEAQRLKGRERGRLLAEILSSDRAPRLILSSHADLAPWFARRHLNLASLRLTAAGVDHLRAVVERRLAYFALPGGPGVTLAPEAFNYLHRRFGGNLRAVEQLLYEACQQLTGPGEITAARLAELRLPPGLEPGSGEPR
jgi:chromosomal replication initiation ATPase DnaA